MKSFGGMFWPALLIGIAVVIVEGFFFESIQNNIGSSPGLILFIVTVLLAVCVPLYSAWNKGELEILP